MNTPLYIVRRTECKLTITLINDRLVNGFEITTGFVHAFCLCLCILDIVNANNNNNMILK